MFATPPGSDEVPSGLPVDVAKPLVYSSGPLQQGPCMRHCTCSLATMALAYAALAYVLASVGYLVYTRCMGTPFADTLTDEQRAIKRESARARGNVFLACLAGAALVLAAWRPFSIAPGPAAV